MRIAKGKNDRYKRDLALFLGLELAYGGMALGPCHEEMRLAMKLEPADVLARIVALRRLRRGNGCGSTTVA